MLGSFTPEPCSGCPPSAAPRPFSRREQCWQRSASARASGARCLRRPLPFRQMWRHRRRSGLIVSCASLGVVGIITSVNYASSASSRCSIKYGGWARPSSSSPPSMNERASIKEIRIPPRRTQRTRSKFWQSVAEPGSRGFKDARWRAAAVGGGRMLCRRVSRIVIIKISRDSARKGPPQQRSAQAAVTSRSRCCARAFRVDDSCAAFRP
jgi:hypothetical protein